MIGRRHLCEEIEGVVAAVVAVVVDTAVIDWYPLYRPRAAIGGKLSRRRWHSALPSPQPHGVRNRRRAREGKLSMRVGCGGGVSKRGAAVRKAYVER